MNGERAIPTHDEAIAATASWLERAVIGLNLCPFAKAVLVKGQIRFAVSDASTTAGLLDDLERELQALEQANPDDLDTTLLIHPGVLTEFLDHNDFIEIAEAAVESLGLTGILQVASFHPDYRFADTPPDDVTNYVNRSPYPTLHLLREASVAVAVATFSDPKEIYERNMATMRRVGVAGCTALGIGSPVRGTGRH